MSAIEPKDDWYPKDEACHLYDSTETLQFVGTYGPRHQQQFNFVGRQTERKKKGIKHMSLSH